MRVLLRAPTLHAWAVQELEISGLAPATEEGLGNVVVHMPTREQLLAAGKNHLVRYINDAGGFLEVTTRPWRPCCDVIVRLLMRVQAVDTKHGAQSWQGFANGRGPGCGKGVHSLMNAPHIRAERAIALHPYYWYFISCS